MAHLVALHPSVESNTQAEVSILDHANLTGSQMRPKILLHSGRSPLRARNPGCRLVAFQVPFYPNLPLDFFLELFIIALLRFAREHL